MKPPSDDNRFHIMYSTGLRLLYNVFIGGLSCAAIYRAVRVCVAPSLTTKGFAEVCELPAALYLLWVSIRGFEDLTTFDPTLYLAYGDGLMVLGLASKILLARFWRSYLAHLKLGAGHKFVDPVGAARGADALIQMLLNLVGNACKFTKEGSMCGERDGLEGDGGDGRIKFAVTDTGLGVPKDKQKIIFELRGQTGDAESQSKGSGIGLSVTSGFAVLTGGALEVRSPVANNRGSEFSFTLELTKTEEVVAEEVVAKEVVKEVVAKEVVTKELQTPLKNLRALVVDDGKMNLEMMGRKLKIGEFKDLKWDFEFAYIGEEALEIVEGGGVFDVIVMDENLQDAGGVLQGTDAIWLIREREGGENAIIVGHGANQADEEKGRASGQDWFWAKPSPPGGEMLLDVMRLWGEKRGGEKEDEAQLPGSVFEQLVE